jgi:NAD(P)-dependent dehydrogenase (short-subunit alcohol dehydrogenase family)
MRHMNLAGRSAIITGANQGLGRAIARHYVTAGASVLLMARGEDLLWLVAAELAPLARQSGQRILVHKGDVSRPEDCQAAVARSVAEMQYPCILVNNAGIYGPMGRLEEVDWQAWVQAIEVNLFGTVLMCRAFIPHLRQQQYGKIVNLSGGGATAPLPGISAYAAAKAAVVRLTETLAHELEEAAVDVNAIAPGALNTRLLDEVLAAGPDKVGKQFYERSLQQRDQGGAPLNKGAALATYLASSESDGITGRLFSALWDDWQRLAQKRDLLAKSDIYTLRRITPEDRGQKWQCA